MIEIGLMTSLYLIIAVTEMALGLFVYSKGRNSPVNRLFLLLTASASIGSLLDLLTFVLADQEAVAWVFRLFLFVIIVEIGTAYKLNTLVPFDTEMIFLRSKSFLFPLSILVLAVFLPLTVGDMRLDPNGWTPVSPVPMVGLALTLVAYMVLMIVSLRRKVIRLKGEKGKKALIFNVTLTFPAAMMLVIMFLSATGSFIPRGYAVGELISMFILSYGILRYDLLVLPRVQEEAAPPSRPFPRLLKGRAYLFEFPDHNRMFESVLQEMGEGVPTLIICRTHPDQLRARYRLTLTPLVWLAQSPGPDRIDPGNLQMLNHIIMEFMGKGPSLIAIEGLEYLLTNNDMNKVLKFLGELRDNVIVEGSFLLVTVDPRTLTERQKAILEREFESVLEEEGAETAI